MIIVGELDERQMTDPVIGKMGVVLYEGHWYALNDQDEARARGYFGRGRETFFKVAHDGRVKRCPICGEYPVLKKRNGRKQFLCLNDESEKSHIEINEVGNHNATSVAKAVRIWNKRCDEIERFGVGFTDWRIQKTVDDANGKEYLSIVQTSADRYSAGSDIVCDVAEHDIEGRRMNVAELICRAPRMRKSCDSAKGLIEKALLGLKTKQPILWNEIALLQKAAESLRSAVDGDIADTEVVEEAKSDSAFGG